MKPEKHGKYPNTIDVYSFGKLITIGELHHEVDLDEEQARFVCRKIDEWLGEKEDSDD